MLREYSKINHLYKRREQTGLHVGKGGRRAGEKRSDYVNEILVD